MLLSSITARSRSINKTDRSPSLPPQPLSILNLSKGYLTVKDLLTNANNG